jgi:hypothetical protein
MDATLIYGATATQITFSEWLIDADMPASIIVILQPV